MNRRCLLVFFVLPLFSSLIGGAMPKDNSSLATTYNVDMRNTLVAANGATIGIEYFIDKQIEDYEHHLSIEERKEIAHALWIIPTQNPYTLTDDRIFLTWTSRKKIYVIKVNEENDNITCTIYKKGHNDRIGSTYNLHPSCGRYIRNWINRHTKVKKELGLS